MKFPMSGAGGGGGSGTDYLNEYRNISNKLKKVVYHSIHIENMTPFHLDSVFRAKESIFT